jgi:chorismate-pyruvate lyase
VAAGPASVIALERAVTATLNGVSFETFIVSRQQRYFMLVDEDVKQQAGIALGETVAVIVVPLTIKA